MISHAIDRGVLTVLVISSPKLARAAWQLVFASSKIACAYCRGAAAADIPLCIFVSLLLSSIHFA